MDTYDWRQYNRQLIAGTINVTVSIIESSAIKKVSFTAEVIDISRVG